MSLSRMSLAAVLAVATQSVVSAGCSHDQKVQAPPQTVAQVPPAPAPRRVVAQESFPVPDLPKTKEDAIFFDFDSALIKDDGQRTLQSVADQVRKQSASLKIEGNCDELGTVEYNLALGEHRARAAKEYLVHLGVPASRIATVSYGSQRPKYPGHDDDAHARNRRDDFVVQ